MSDNELIEEFYISQGVIPKHDNVYFSESDWNTLMPVVEKIGNFGIWTIRPGFAYIENWTGKYKFKFMKSTQDFEEQNGESISWIFLVACVCIEFIKWYNEQNKKS